MTTTVSRVARRTRVIVLCIGVVYAALGIIGFAYVGWGTFGYEEPVRMLGVFGTSTLLNIVHTFVGVVALIAVRAPYVFGAVGLVAFTAMAAFGVVARSFPGAGDPLNLTWWNVGLYVLTALACGFVFTARLRAAAAEPRS